MSDNFFLKQVAAKSARKLRALRAGQPVVWFGLGMAGLIGWSVALPSIAGALLGVWLDQHHPRAHSWTLMLLVAGLVLGCANAWHWVAQQNDAMKQEPENEND
jgi:ATP synthase protein I